MKKAYKGLMIALIMSFTLLSSCASPYTASSSSADPLVGADAKIYVERSSEIASYVQISKDTLEDMVGLSKLSRHSDFAIYIYMFGCSGCAAMRGYIETLALETHLVVYGISYSDYSSLYADDKTSYHLVSGTPTLFFYSQGKPVSSLLGASQSYATFKAAFLSHVEDASLFTLNGFTLNTNGADEGTNFSYSTYENTTESALDAAISGNSDLAVLFTWKRCSDCTNLYDDYLLSYAKEVPNYSFYSFDVDYFRINKPGSEPADTSSDEYKYYKMWIDFSSKYGFGSYCSGKVPSLVSFHNGAPSSFVVFANEGTSQETVASSITAYSFPQAYSDEVKALSAANEDALRQLAHNLEFSQMKKVFQTTYPSIVF